MNSTLTSLFQEEISHHPEYSEAVELIRQNSSGKIWLIGGFVYRTLAQRLYDRPIPAADLDFIVEQASPELKLTPGWEITHNRFGNPKFVSSRKQIDYVPLNNIYSILRRGLPPHIEHFLTGTPLTIQSIAYDLQERKIIGDLGIKALASGVIAVNDPISAEYAAAKKGKTLPEYMEEKAGALGFTLVLP